MNTLFLAGLGASLMIAVASAQSITTFGATENGLRLGMDIDRSQVEPAIRVGIENVGPSDLVVNLGFMLANGRLMIPAAIQMTATDLAGQPVTMRFLRTGPGAVAGRMDDYLVALGSGASHYLRVATIDRPGRYRIAATFDGRPARLLNSDTPGIALLTFWIGQLRSNEVVWDVPPATR